MDVLTAVLPLVLMLGGGGVIAVLVKYRGRQHKSDSKELPTDPLTDLFIDREECDHWKTTK